MEYSDEELKKIKQEYIEAINELIVEYTTTGHKLSPDSCKLCQISNTFYNIPSFGCHLKCPASQFNQKNIEFNCSSWVFIYKHEPMIEDFSIKSEWRSLYWKHNLEIIKKLPLEYFQPGCKKSYELELPPNSDDYKEDKDSYRGFVIYKENKDSYITKWKCFEILNPNNRTCAKTKKEIIKKIDKYLDDTPWYVPAGLKRGKKWNILMKN